MKTKRKLFNMTGVLAVLLLALVFGLAGCDTDGDDPGSEGDKGGVSPLPVSPVQAFGLPVADL